jgi:hypothetical protein
MASEMFPLTIIDESSPEPDGFKPNGRCVSRWTGPAGAVRALYKGQAWNWIVFEGVATFRFRPGAYAAEALLAQGVNRKAATEFYQHHVLPLVLQDGGLEVLHASAVLHEGRVLGFCGEKGSGKSTIAYALGRRGCRQYADDALVIDASAGRIESVALPFSPRMRRPSAQFFVQDTDEEWESRRHSGRHSIGALFIIGDPLDTPAEPEIHRLSDLPALQGVLSHARQFDATAAISQRRHLQNFLEIALALPVFSLRYSRGFDRLDTLLSALIRAADGAKPAALSQAS